MPGRRKETAGIRDIFATDPARSERPSGGRGYQREPQDGNTLPGLGDGARAADSIPSVHRPGPDE